MALRRPGRDRDLSASGAHNPVSAGGALGVYAVFPAPGGLVEKSPKTWPLHHRLERPRSCAGKGENPGRHNDERQHGLACVLQRGSLGDRRRGGYHTCLCGDLVGETSFRALGSCLRGYGASWASRGGISQDRRPAGAGSLRGPAHSAHVSRGAPRHCFCSPPPEST